MSFGFDPSLILGANKAAEPSINDTLQTLGQLATGRAQQQHIQAQLADLARSQQQQDTLAGIYRSNADAPEGLATALMRGGYGKQAFDAQDQESQLLTQGAQRTKLLRDAQDAQRKHIGELFYGTKDDADYQARRQELASNPDPHLSMYANMLPEKFDPAVTERLGNLAVPAVERAKIAGRGNGAGQVIVADDGTQYVANKQTGAATTVRDESGKAIKARPKGGGAGGGAGGASGGLTPEALDAAAQNFLTTKEMPQLGAGKASFGLRVKIMNRALELKPGADLAGAGADYKANTASLKKLQTTADAVDAFENTAGKNLDTFLELAKGMGDTGSPLFNAPYRKFQEGVAGDPRMAGVSAARATAIAEIGKVLSGGTGGAALTEGARHEVESLIKPDATLAQIQQAANVLKRDMANRKAAVQEQLKEIQKRISGKPEGKEGGHGAVTKTEFSKSRNKTRFTYADGHREEVDGQR
jgi:hypothetical protein